MKLQGALDHAALAPVVADLFLGGLGAVRAPPGPDSMARRSVRAR
jgi:hypothetical protein